MVAVPADPRDSHEIAALATELKQLECADLLQRLRTKSDDELGWVRYKFPDQDGQRAWQVIVINRWLERDKFFRNILPQWIGTIAGTLSFAVSVLALIVAIKALK